jgi:hypothetical protein
MIRPDDLAAKGASEFALIPASRVHAMPVTARTAP